MKPIIPNMTVLCTRLLPNETYYTEYDSALYKATTECARVQQARNIVIEMCAVATVNPCVPLYPLRVLTKRLT